MKVASKKTLPTSNPRMDLDEHLITLFDFVKINVGLLYSSTNFAAMIPIIPSFIFGSYINITSSLMIEFFSLIIKSFILNQFSFII